MMRSSDSSKVQEKENLLCAFILAFSLRQQILRSQLALTEAICIMDKLFNIVENEADETVSAKVRRTKSVSFKFHGDDNTTSNLLAAPSPPVRVVEEVKVTDEGSDSSDSEDSRDNRGFVPVFHPPAPDKKRGSLTDKENVLSTDSFCKNDSIYNALKRKRPASEVMRVIQQSPDACQFVDSQGNLPLHIAASYVASLEIVQSLLRYYPEAIKTHNRQGQLPLHRAAAMNNAINVVTFLIKANSEALEMADSEGNLPVHYAAAFNNVFILKLCLKRSKYLYTTAVNNNDGFLPIHMCALHNSTCDKARLLIKYNPYALHMRSKYNDLPVHLAVMYNVHKEVVKFMVSHSPDGLLSQHSIHDLLDTRLVNKYQNVQYGYVNRLHNLGSRPIHVCGASYAGKTVLAHWLHRKLALQNHSKKTHSDHLDQDNILSRLHSITHMFNAGFEGKEFKVPLHVRTEGVNIKRVRYVNRAASQQVDYILYDYSGKEEYLLNHSRFLSANDSVYIVMVALYDVRARRLRTFDEMFADYSTWLQYIYSTTYSYDQMNRHEVSMSGMNDTGTSSSNAVSGILNARKLSSKFGASMLFNSDSKSQPVGTIGVKRGASSKVVPSYDDRTRNLFGTIGDQSNSNLNSGFSKEVVSIPIITVVNTFAQYTHNLVTDEQVQELGKRLQNKAKELYTLSGEVISRPRFVTSADNKIFGSLPSFSMKINLSEKSGRVSGDESISVEDGDDSNLIQLSHSRELATIVGVSSASTDMPIYRSYSMKGDNGLSNHNLSAIQLADGNSNTVKAPLLNPSHCEKSLVFFDPLIVDVQDKTSIKAMLPLFYNANNYIYSKVSTGLRHAILHIEKLMDKDPVPVIMEKGNYVMQLRKRLSTLPILYDMRDIFHFNLIIEVLADSVYTSFEKSGRILVVANLVQKMYNPSFYQYNINQDSHVSGSGLAGKQVDEMVITNPFYVTNYIFNAILSELQVLRNYDDIEQGIKSYVVNRKELDTMLHNHYYHNKTFGHNQPNNKHDSLRNSSSNLLKGDISESGFSTAPANLPFRSQHSSYSVFSSSGQNDHSLFEALTTTELMEVGGYIIPIEFDDKHHVLYCPGFNALPRSQQAIRVRQNISNSSLPGLDYSPPGSLSASRANSQNNYEKPLSAPASNAMPVITPRGSLFFRSIAGNKKFDPPLTSDSGSGKANLKSNSSDSADNSNSSKRDTIGRTSKHPQQQYLLFGMISSSSPRNMLSIYLLPTHTTLLSSYFILTSQQYTFIPGFFMKLFYMILSMDNFRNDFIYVYKNAFVAEIHRKQVVIAPLEESEEILHYKKQIIIHPVQDENNRLGFQLLIGITPGKNVHNDTSICYDNHKNFNLYSLESNGKEPGLSPSNKPTNASYVNAAHNVKWYMQFYSNLANLNGQYNVTQFTTYYDEKHAKHVDPDYPSSNDGKYHRTVVEKDSNKIKKFLNTSVWNLEMEEIPLQAERCGDEHMPFVNQERLVVETTSSVAGPGPISLDRAQIVGIDI
ncbi:ankyrin repeat domain-containing protein [archaeon]|nr:MAG: ankyrin repeat domain-containing protein [archaeon]